MNIFNDETQISNLMSSFLIYYTKNDFIEKFLNILLYQSDFETVSNNEDIFTFFKTFVKDITLDVNNNELKILKKNIISHYNLVDLLIDIKEDISINLNINYDNVINHYSNLKSETLSLLSNVCENKITTISDFRTQFNEIFSEVKIYNEFKILRPIINDLDNFIFESNEYGGSVVNWIKNFQNIISSANTNFSHLAIENENNLESNFIFSDEVSIVEPVGKIIEFLKVNYRTFKTGYAILDNFNLIDSSSLTILAGPTNHAKSIFLLNIIRKMIENSCDFNENDVFIFISLEDDQTKIFKRLLSIFGNINSLSVKKLFSQASDLLRSTESKEITEIFNEITIDSIINLTKNKIRFISRYNGDSQFSASDACRIMDSLIFQGMTPRALFIDYVDLMVPSNKNTKYYSGNNEASDYVKQGNIMHECRKLSRKYSIPVMTITQNTRYSEDATSELDNSHIADSFRKARFSDNILMIRQRPELDILNDAVNSELTDSSEEFNFQNLPVEYISSLIPFEVKITKAKDGPKNIKKFHLFCTQNLRIYESIKHFLDDIQICNTKSKNLDSKINMLGLDSDVSIEEHSEFNIDNLLI